jgi:hypothetical protein
MICVARGFGKLLNSRKDVQEALSNYVSRVGEKLRQEKLCANMIQIFVQTNAHRSKPHPKGGIKTDQFEWTNLPELGNDDGTPKKLELF